jgi:hypothetical protein
MSKFGSLAASDEPLLVELIDPVTLEVIRDKDGNASYIKAYPEDGAKGREFDKKERAAQLEARKLTPVDRMEVNMRKCAHLTTEWYLVDPDTREQLPVACTFDNAKEFYSLPATNWFEQVWLKVVNNANFMKRSAKTSSPSQSGASEIVAS